MSDNASYELLNQNRTMKFVFLAIFAVIIGFLLFIFRGYLWLFLYSMIFFVVLKPMHDRVLSLVKIRILSATIVILFLLCIVIIPMMYLLVILGDQAYELYAQIHFDLSHDFIRQINQNKIVSDLMVLFNIQQGELAAKITSFIQNTTMSVFSSITSIISFPIALAIKFLLMLLILFFLFKDGHIIDKSLYRIIPLPDDLERDVVVRLKKVIYILMMGNLMIMCLQGFMVGLGLYIAGVKMPLLWGSLAAILSLIPVIGTTFIWIPAAVFLACIGQYRMAIFTAVWCFSWYMLLENLVKPKVLGDKLDFHPLIFFFLLLASIQAFSLPGVIIGPILLSLFYSFWEIYKLLDEYDMHGRIKLKKRMEETPPAPE
ncbi:MAG TPA: AI-2E family transporter [Spirochaetota bacterium]|nr:AI-2E family transporter [Spirochaetota bacterium]